MNNLTKTWFRKKKPVTLIAGIICKDGIVVAADGQTTRGSAKQLGAEKISVVQFENGIAAVAESGAAALSTAAIEILRKIARTRRIEDETTVGKTCEQAVREVVCGITKHLNPLSPDLERQSFLCSEENYFELVLAHYFGFKPRIDLIRSAWCVPMSLPSGEHFLTSGVAANLANYILREHTSKGMEKKLASVIAIKTVKDAIDNVEACGLPIRLAIVHKPFRKRPYRVEPTDPKAQVHIGKRVYEDVAVHPSRVELCDDERVEGITKIISRIEENTKSSRNKKFHDALKHQQDVFFKRQEKAWSDFCKKHPDLAEQAVKQWESSAETYEILPDEE